MLKKSRKLSRRKGCSVFAVAFLLWSVPVAAEDFRLDEPCAPEVTEGRRAVLEYEGQTGIWFHLEVSRCLLARVQLLPELQLELDLWERRKAESEALEAVLRRSRDLAVEESTLAREALSEALRGRRRAEEALAAWYRSPVLWFSVGVIVAGALVGLGAWALGSTR